ncbi:LPS O-antigen chain length determinant protein WzzB [Pusillimonas sp.]|uniref:LPS O-antigen chain length determinant protein WzzB n=1 Tax=Pusillimonas sp. TaxID=3040095 RepID=UPI0029BD8CB4|nr:Wzz/FepE/Etk N-terminal domain-containing protein [Pusillimonas sp.]MDX3895317.1 Wzz/FepE/Etk N-terminal domain-containing protein [Pusillimonas sp.]
MGHNATPPLPSDEMDLRQLVKILWHSKILITLVALVVTCGAIIYVFVSTPIYQTAVTTLPPTASDLSSYNVASQLTGSAIRGTVPDSAPGIEPLTPQEAYKVFLRYLNSSSIRQAFFEQYYLPTQKNKETEGDKQRAWRKLNKELTIALPKRPDEYESTVTLEGGNPKTLAKWANTYVSLAVQAANEDLLSKLAGEVEIRKRSVEDQIRTLRQVAEKTRQDRIIRLEGALAIAESIGLEVPTDGAPLIAIDARGLSTESVDYGSLLYLRGAKALRAELQHLTRREASDAYIAELPDLLKKQALLNAVNLNPESITAATIDRAAIAPEDPIRPNKRLISALGLILGIILGIFIALMVHMLKPTKKFE